MSAAQYPINQLVGDLDGSDLLPFGLSGEILHAYYFGAISASISAEMSLSGAVTGATAGISASMSGSMSLTGAITAATAGIDASIDATMRLTGQIYRATGGLYALSPSARFDERGVYKKQTTGKTPVLPADRKHADPATTQFARETREALKQINASSIAWGKIMEVEFETTSTVVAVKTGFDRPVTGYIVIYCNADANIYVANETTEPGTIHLKASAFCRARLWVF